MSREEKLGAIAGMSPKEPGLRNDCDRKVDHLNQGVME